MRIDNNCSRLCSKKEVSCRAPTQREHNPEIFLYYFLFLINLNRFVQLQVIEPADTISLSTKISLKHKKIVSGINATHNPLLPKT